MEARNDIHPAELAIEDAIKTHSNDVLCVDLPDRRNKKQWGNWKWSDPKAKLPQQYSVVETLPFTIYLGDECLLEAGVIKSNAEGVALELQEVAEKNDMRDISPIVKLRITGHVRERLVITHNLKGESFAASQMHIFMDRKSHIDIQEKYQYTSFSGFYNQSTSVELMDDAQLNVVSNYHNAANGSVITSHKIHQHFASQYQHLAVGFGGHLMRQEHDVNSFDENTSVKLLAAYALDDNNHMDITSNVAFHEENGAAMQLVKGVVRDKAKAIFQGKFFVDQKAQFTDAQMAHHALMLSDRADVYAKPELEIYADDVACAHGNTVGALDADALFYMRQRGLSEAEAKALLVQAFLGEVVDSIDGEDLRDDIQAELQQWMAKS